MCYSQPYWHIIATHIVPAAPEASRARFCASVMTDNALRGGGVAGASGGVGDIWEGCSCIKLFDAAETSLGSAAEKSFAPVRD